MKTVITYGTFDLFHTGHLNLLKRAKALGARLIVGVTSDAYDLNRGKLNVVQSCAERIENVKKSGLADLILIEEEEGQKIQDVQKYGADIFAIGSDWVGKFDYLNEFCQVVYLERTKGVSSSMIRHERNRIIRMGIAGHGRIAKRFLMESKYVSGVEVTAVYGRDLKRVEQFVNDFEISSCYVEYESFLNDVDAVYIALPHHLHFEYTRLALLKGKHVLCEKPLALSYEEAEELFALAKEKGCVLQEAVKTAFAPAFIQLTGIARSGCIGSIKAIDATFTKLVTDKCLREYDASQGGGSLTELGTYVFFVVAKLLGLDPTEINFYTAMDNCHEVDIYTRADIIYSNAVATVNVGIGVKKEGDLCIAGTKGYIYVPAPWWKTEYFEVRYEDGRHNRKYFAKFEGDGMRYELTDFIKRVNGREEKSYLLTSQESLFLAQVIGQYRKGKGVRYISG